MPPTPARRVDDYIMCFKDDETREKQYSCENRRHLCLRLAKINKIYRNTIYIVCIHNIYDV